MSRSIVLLGVVFCGCYGYGTKTLVSPTAFVQVAPRPPGAPVEILYGPVKQEHRALGSIEVRGAEHTSWSTLETKLAGEARLLGADAVALVTRSEVTRRRGVVPFESKSYASPVLRGVAIRYWRESESLGRVTPAVSPQGLPAGARPTRSGAP